MLPPRRHRHRSEQCPGCQRTIGEVRPSSGGGKYLVIDQALVIAWASNDACWRIVCLCGRVTMWQGKEIKWRQPDQQAA
jgi:hypothetical protein